MWTNADEVVAFLEEHKDRKFEVGDRFVLPDIEQEYAVVSVRAFRHGGKFKVFLDLEAVCAMEGCTELLLFSKEVNEWRSSLYLTRSCAGHRGQFVSPRAKFWKTSLELLSEAPKKAKAKPKAKPKGKADRDAGAVQGVVLATVGEMSLLSGVLPLGAVFAEAVSRLPKAEGGRDTRRQRVVRAVNALVARGVLHRVAGGGLSAI